MVRRWGRRSEYVRCKTVDVRCDDRFCLLEQHFRPGEFTYRAPTHLEFRSLCRAMASFHCQSYQDELDILSS